MWNVEIGTEAPQFPEKEYINGIFFAVRNGKMDQFAHDLPVVARQGPGVGGVGVAAGEVPVAQAAALTPLQDVVQAPRHPAMFIIIFIDYLTIQGSRQMDLAAGVHQILQTGDTFSNVGIFDPAL